MYILAWRSERTSEKKKKESTFGNDRQRRKAVVGRVEREGG